MPALARTTNVGNPNCCNCTLACCMHEQGTNTHFIVWDCSV
jgi:hypothetical protein